MTTLAEIPSCKALHLPTPDATTLPLSMGELTLVLLPASPPARPSPTLTLTIGWSSWAILPITPVRKVQSQDEHPTYLFSPVPADGGSSVGQVKIVMKDSSSQREWEATQLLCTKLEDALKSQGVWDERILFVNDTDEDGQKGWGESLAGAVLSAGQAIAERLTTYTDKHVDETNPEHPPPPSQKVTDAAGTMKSATATVAEYASAGAEAVGSFIHEGGKKLGALLPDQLAKPAPPVSEQEKSGARKIAEEEWEQITVAAEGIAGATTTVGEAMSQNAHKAVEHNFGEEADKVAKDIGQAGANIGDAGLSAVKTTSIVMQGSNAASGAAAGAPTSQ
ncbi:hypothetical protein TREMEDRAFT_69409 [Tremella mesenterica DSM 1558]|uniref:uncharacterized protein n=1 Tax=Tremella mesenterica (strain ATCC 24925 / CBS 8224 / DSM 1558 / NBRC 9311 / NRRL Y-6157 / RJB 2259-6 / UBC 559-6) TaxID=578456 RepID=UPI0003F48E31|nr:uncharacterized protein TREMEDRAFT_69409 [Tremella mesenterica DSM 1558]EIW67803.1 hypothetical protein TREMEDRAFT_69409 [Tremella mesenterica DSM 1558]